MANGTDRSFFLFCLDESDDGDNDDDDDVHICLCVWLLLFRGLDFERCCLQFRLFISIIIINYVCIIFATVFRNLPCIWGAFSLQRWIFIYLVLVRSSEWKG